MSSSIATKASKLLLGASLFIFLTGATAITTKQARVAAPSSLNLSGVSAAQGTSLSFAPADHVHSLTGILPESYGGTGSGVLNCSAGQVITSNGSTYACITAVPTWPIASRLVASDASDWAYWPINETSGTTIFNTTGDSTLNFVNSNGSSCTHGNTWDLGRMLDCPASYVDVYQTTNSSVPSSSDVTFSAWFFPKAAPVSTFNLINLISTALSYQPDGTVLCTFYDSLGTSSVSRSNTNALTFNRWHHIGCAKAHGVTTKIYIDGVDVTFSNTGPSSANLIQTNSGASFWHLAGDQYSTNNGAAAAYGTGTGPTFAISEVRIASVTRPPSWFQNVWNNAQASPMTLSALTLSNLNVTGLSGQATGNGTAGVGVPATISAGQGGTAYRSGGHAGAGGDYTLSSGPGGTGNSQGFSGSNPISAGNGGTFNLVSGPGGDAASDQGNQPANGGAGGTINITAGRGGNSNTNNTNSADENPGNGGNVNIQAGTAGTAAATTGASAVHPAIDGSINIGTTVGSVSIGRSGVPVTITGVNMKVAKGTIALAAGSASVTVPSGVVCTASDTTAVAAVKASVSSTTLTLAGTGTDVIAYLCF